MRKYRLQVLLGVLLLLPVSASGVAPQSSGEAPNRIPAKNISTRWPIKHVIFIIKENRSFDQMFGRFPGANGATEANDHGTMRPLTPVTLQRLPMDIRHNYPIALASYDHGKMDGFNVSDGADRYAFTEMEQRNIPNYWEWASEFVLSDNFFASAMGPSFPNHLYTIAASSARTHDNPDTPRSVKNLGVPKSWGCDAPDGVTVRVSKRDGRRVRVRPCFDRGTLGDRLTAKGIGWRYYSALPPVLGYIWSSYDAIRHIRETRQWHRHVRPIHQLISDIRNTRLPPVTWITPRFALSEHPEYNICHGENWSTRVINAVMRSSIWKNTAIFLTWDDWGGFYDHVPPPQVDGFGLGFRVPLLEMSPYSKSGWIDHRLGEFTSVVRFTEDNWRLARLTTRDRGASDLAYDFNFRQQPRPPHPLPLRTDCRGPVDRPGDPTQDYGDS